MGTDSSAAAKAARDRREKNDRRNWVFMTNSFPVVPTRVRWVNWICHQYNRERGKRCPLYCPLYLTALRVRRLRPTFVPTVVHICMRDDFLPEVFNLRQERNSLLWRQLKLDPGRVVVETLALNLIALPDLIGDLIDQVAMPVDAGEFKDPVDRDSIAVDHERVHPGLMNFGDLRYEILFELQPGGQPDAWGAPVLLLAGILGIELSLGFL